MKMLLERGFLIIEKIRDILRDLGDDPDELCPYAQPDVPFMVRVEALMHDTCNTAEAAAKLLISEKNEMGIEHFGEEAWAAMPEERRRTFDVDCGNHTRQLPIVAFRRKAKKYIEPLLGQFRAEAMAGLGFGARIELDVESLVRSLTKLLDLT